MYSIEDALKNIKLKYSEIRDMTELVNVDANVEKCISIIDKRRDLLLDIDKEHKFLTDHYPTWQEICNRDKMLKEIKSEIATLITSVVSTDSIINTQLTNKIDSVKKEIIQVGKSSKATLSYSRQKIR